MILIKEKKYRSLLKRQVPVYKGWWKSAGNSGSGKSLTLYSQMQSELCNDRGISQAGITKLLYSTTSQNRGPRWGTAQKMVSDGLLFHFFPDFSPLPHGPKSTRLNKIHISTRESSLSEGDFSPIWRNNLVHILLETMVEYPLWFTIITNNFYSNPSPRMVVPFLLVSLHWKEKCLEREMKSVQTVTKKFQSKRKT